MAAANHQKKGRAKRIVVAALALAALVAVGVGLAVAAGNDPGEPDYSGLAVETAPTMPQPPKVQGDDDGADDAAAESPVPADADPAAESARPLASPSTSGALHVEGSRLVDAAGEPVGFISDGDILKRLSPRRESFTDPIVLINRTVTDDEGYEQKLAKVMQMRASEIGASRPICVSVHANLTDVCRVLAENHLKKVPVLEDGHIVGIINRSDITQYSMAAYLADHPQRALYCGEGDDEGTGEACTEGAAVGGK